MSNEERPWERGPSIRTQHGAVFNHENVELYNVEKAIQAIIKKPTNFQFLVLPTAQFVAQVMGRGSLDMPYVASLSNEDAVRPILLGTYEDHSVRVLDGYHRIRRLMDFQIKCVAAWRLSVEQTNAIRLPVQYLPSVERV